MSQEEKNIAKKAEWRIDIFGDNDSVAIHAAHNNQYVFHQSLAN